MRIAECIVENIDLPHPRYQGLWESIVADEATKRRLLNQAVLSFRLRERLSFVDTALHGLITLYGPPGTGKTTLARGLGVKLAPLVAGNKVRFVEVDPHGLMSAEHGQSQQRVMELLGEHVPALADDGAPTVVLIDEVESMTVARSAASLSANPADVHRATDAVLTALDRVAASHPNILFVATSNFTDALDEAFKSRSDAAIHMPLPEAAGIHVILHKTLSAFAEEFPTLQAVADSAKLQSVAVRLTGKDGRQVRKFLTEAMARRIDTAIDPGTLTIQDLVAAAEGWSAERQEVGRAAA